VRLHEGHRLLAHVVVVHALHPAAVVRVGAAVVERLAHVVVHREHLDSAALDELAQGADHALVAHLPLVAAARREGEERRAPVAVHDDAHLAAEPVGEPAVILGVHDYSRWRPDASRRSTSSRTGTPLRAPRRVQLTAAAGVREGEHAVDRPSLKQAEDESAPEHVARPRRVHHVDDEAAARGPHGRRRGPGPHVGQRHHEQALVAKAQLAQGRLVVGDSGEGRSTCSAKMGMVTAATSSSVRSVTRSRSLVTGRPSSRARRAALMAAAWSTSSTCTSRAAARTSGGTSRSRKARRSVRDPRARCARRCPRPPG